MLRVGHRGAAALAPPNTLAAVEAALEVGVDMIEFDVAPGEVVAHDEGHPGPPLAAFLAELRELVPGDLGFIVDLKREGYEEAVVARCEEAGVLDRCIFSTPHLGSHERLPARARGSFTFKPRRLSLGPRPDFAPLYRRSGARDATVRVDAVTATAIDEVHRNGGRLFAWTVNRPADLARMRALGVDGVITDDPRLFHRA